MYAIRENCTIVGSVNARDNGAGEWWRGDRWTPAAGEAKVFDSRDDAQQEIARHALGHRAGVVEIDD